MGTKDVPGEPPRPALALQAADIGHLQEQAAGGSQSPLHGHKMWGARRTRKVLSTPIPRAGLAAGLHAQEDPSTRTGRSRPAACPLSPGAASDRQCVSTVSGSTAGLGRCTPTPRCPVATHPRNPPSLHWGVGGTSCRSRTGDWRGPVRPSLSSSAPLAREMLPCSARPAGAQHRVPGQQGARTQRTDHPGTVRT